MAQFVAIRVIVLQREDDKRGFADWMTGDGGFLDHMGGFFRDKGLEKIMFLQGNKESGLTEQPYPLKSNESASVTAAGANADFAWITYWTSKDANQAAWQAERPPAWVQIWKTFMKKCYKKACGRPKHGPPYDFLGKEPDQIGHGAGCLVEGFELIYCKSEWPVWPLQ